MNSWFTNRSIIKTHYYKLSATTLISNHIASLVLCSDRALTVQVSLGNQQPPAACQMRSDLPVGMGPPCFQW